MVKFYWFSVLSTMLFFLVVGVTSQYQTYTNQARRDCYIPSGEQYDRSYFRQIGGMRRLPPRFRIANGGRIVFYCKKDIQYDAIMKSATSRCAYGKWRPELPSCIAHRCGDIPTVANTTASEKPNKHRTYPDGYVVTYACPSTLVLRGNNSVTCTRGTWTEPGFTCEEPVQPELCRKNIVENADVAEVTATFYRVTCHFGYALKDEQSVFKCAEGQWMLKTPRCYPKMCPNLYAKYDVLSASNGTRPAQIDKNGDLVHGLLVRIRCPARQQPYNGVQDVKCVNGEWKPRRPVCRRYCTIPAFYHRFSRYTFELTNERVRDVVPHAQAVNQRCLGEDTSSERRCINGRWRPRLKRCKPGRVDISPVDFRILRSGPKGEPGCPLIEGKSVFMSPDGSLTYDADSLIHHGQTIKQICEDGRVDLENQHVLQCDQGTWVPDLKACPDIDCDEYFNSQEGREGTIDSPGYKDNFPRNTICSYHFEMEAFEKIKITFATFELTGDLLNCTTSYLGYQSSEIDGNMTKLCGADLPPTIEVYGPNVTITWNTFRAEVAEFEAHFEIISDVPTCIPPNEREIVYTPVQTIYKINDVIHIAGCQDDKRVFIGSDVGSCQENGTWNASFECAKLQDCVLHEKNGIQYQVGDSTFLAGNVEHGTVVIVSRKCDDVNNDTVSYQMIGCENGNVTSDLIGCQDMEGVSDSHCFPPFVAGVQLYPKKDVYALNDIVLVTGCGSDTQIPTGAKELVCLGKDHWFGSVECLNYCEYGVVSLRPTNYSYFLRQSDIQYHQIANVVDSSACFVECDMYEKFVCRSFEYREYRSTCTLLDEDPNPCDFKSVDGEAGTRVYERACDDKCRIPHPIPTDMIFRDKDDTVLVAGQAVLTGSTIRVTCKNTAKVDDTTCIGGYWDDEFNNNFCMQGVMNFLEQFT